MACEETLQPGIDANIQRRDTSESPMTSIGGALPQALRMQDESSESTRAQSRHRWVERVMQREGSGIQRLLWRLLGREADVLDAYQDCFCKLAARGKRNIRTNVRAYAYRTASNIAIEMIRSRRRHAAHLPAVAADRNRELDNANDETVDEADGRFDQLREGIAKLPEHLRNVIVLRDLNRFSYAKVGRMLGIEPTTARVYRRHAVVKLAELACTGEES